MKRFGLILLLGGSIGVAAVGIDVDLAYVEDITRLTGECFIRGITLDRVADESSLEVSTRQYEGLLSLADGTHAVRVTTAADETPRLWVDQRGTGDLRQSEWDRVLVDGTLLASVEMEVMYGAERAPYRIFLMWSRFLPHVLTFCRNSYREGTVALGGRTVRVAVVDADTDGRYDVLEGGVLLVDTDGDGALLASGDSHERYFLNEAFSLDGIGYVVRDVTPKGDRLVLDVSSAPVTPKLPILPGYEAPTFAWRGAGEAEQTLESYRGRVVVLDFWAGWCAPCVAEMPTFSRLLEQFEGEPVTVIGINLDRTEDAFRESVATLGVDWPQAFDGADGPISSLYRIEGIPMTYVLDAGGIIRARGVRGDDLVEMVGEVLEEMASQGTDE